MQVLEVERAAVKRLSWLIKRISICKKQTVMQIEATFRKFSRYLFSALEQQPDYLFLFDAAKVHNWSRLFDFFCFVELKNIDCL